MKTRRWVHGGLLLSALLFSGAAFGQTGVTPPRIDPAEPDAPSGGGLPAGWSYFDVIRGMPRATLGKLAVDAWGGVYVWSIRQVPVGWKEPLPALSEDPMPRREVPIEDRTVGRDGGPVPGAMDAERMAPVPRREETGEPPWPDEGVGGPLLPVRLAVISTLYYLNGGQLSPELEVSDETGATVFIAKSGDVFVATELEDGTVRAYRRHAGVWRQDEVPAGVRGPVEAMAGENTVFFRAGTQVLRHTGNHWKEEFACANLAAFGGLVYLGRDQIMAPCACGRHVFDGAKWVLDPDEAAPHTHNLWGDRDAAGDLHLFAAGCNPAHTKLEIFQFIEDAPGPFRGKFVPVAEEPRRGESGAGTAGQAVWGAGVHDIYLAGAVHQNGHLYHFDGARWNNITPEVGIPPMIDVAGTRWGELWVSLADGRLLHRQAEAVPLGGAPRAPAPAPALPLADPLGGAMLVVSSVESGVATTRFEVADPGPVSLEVFDLAGRSVATLENGVLPAGSYRRNWDTKGVANGIYFCRLRSGAVELARKVLVQR